MEIQNPSEKSPGAPTKLWLVPRNQHWEIFKLSRACPVGKDLPGVPGVRETLQWALETLKF